MPDDESDLVALPEHDVGQGVARAMAIDVGADMRAGPAIAACAVASQPHSPLREQRPEREPLIARRLDVDHAAGRMGVEGREEAVVLPPDARTDRLGLA